MTTINDLEFIVPCGGRSSRNYPHSKSVAHKSLLPFGDGRLIDFILRDILNLGGRHITIICSNQATIDLFKEALATDKTVEDKLRAQGKIAIADALAETFLPEDIDLKFIIQDKPIGTAHVLGIAHRISHNRHGIMVFPDDIILSLQGGKSHLKNLVDSFLNDSHQILLTGIEKEDVSNNAIIHNGRVIEKPKIVYNHVGGFSPFAFPKEMLDFVEKQVDTYEQTGKLPDNLPMKEWVYTDGINQFLDSEPENKWCLRMEMLIPECLLLDTGTLPLYEKAQIRALLTLSRFREENIKVAKEILKELQCD